MAEEAHILHRTVEDIHARNRDADSGVVEAEIAAALREVRHEAICRVRDREA